MTYSFWVLVLAASLRGSTGAKRFWAFDGCWDKPGSFHLGLTRGAALDEKSNTAAVRCCSMDGSTCKTPGSCPSGKDHSEAVTICSALNMRLCTLDELLADVCCGTGCNFDYMTNVWTSSEVAVRPVLSDLCNATNSQTVS